MNKWKIAFWFCLTTLFLVTAFGIYCVIDQGITLTYMKDGYEDTENDLDNISKIINETDLTKLQIKKTLRPHHLYEYMDFNKDTVSLDRVSLIFKDDKLFKITKE
jgi:hypothetical protein